MSQHSTRPTLAYIRIRSNTTFRKRQHITNKLDPSLPQRLCFRPLQLVWDSGNGVKALKVKRQDLPGHLPLLRQEQKEKAKKSHRTRAESRVLHSHSGRNRLLCMDLVRSLLEPLRPGRLIIAERIS